MLFPDVNSRAGKYNSVYRQTVKIKITNQNIKFYCDIVSKELKKTTLKFLNYFRHGNSQFVLHDRANFSLDIW
jgi:hypothetical protein